MRWFRFGRKKEQAPAEAAASAAPPEPVVETPAPAAGDEEAQKAKRRRGSRGGRGRKKPGEQRPAAAPDAKAKAKAEPTGRTQQRQKAEPKPERKPSARRERPQRRRPAPRRAPLPAAKRELLVSVDVGEQRVAVLEDEQVAEVYLERPERRSIAGNIYLGVVDNVLPGMEAAFVEIGLEKNGFLYVDEIVRPELEGRRHGKKIHELIDRGEKVMVQAVKDPMKTKGARLTMEISLPGRFVVYQPNGEGTGVSRRLEDDERQRLKDILKNLDLGGGGVIVRTAAEGASAEDVERDLVFLQRLWKSIEARAKQVEAPALVYQEAELPLRVVRDLFTGDFQRALVDDDRTLKRVVGYLKKTSPHMVERVHRYREKPALMEAFGVDAQIKSTLNRRVDLPSGGYLVFDYAEAFTVIDVNTGRFVGSRSRTSGARLEDTITKNNLEAVTEVVRQLRLRDIGGIIVIDFIDMANPKNRSAVEEALRNELEKDRTKTYVVEISPLGLVEMTRQNVTDGPREILTRKCPTCGGDGIVISDTSAAIDVERKLRALTAASRHQAYKVELAARTASILVGPGASRLRELEERTRRRFLIETVDDMHVDHFVVLAQGKLADLVGEAPVEEGAELELRLVELARYDTSAAVGKVDGLDVCVADAAKLVGKKVKVRVERVFDGTAYATVVGAHARRDDPITAESEAEKPTRKPAARKASAAVEEPLADEEAAADEAEEAVAATADAEGEDEAPPKKKTRRGSRGGRGRKKKPAAEGAEAVAAVEPGAEAEHEPELEAEAAAEVEAEAAPEVEAADEPVEAAAAGDGAGPRIHVPDRELEVRTEAGEDVEGDPAATDGTGGAPGKKKTRRGSRGGRGRKKKTAGTNGASAEETTDEAADEPEEAEDAPEPAAVAEEPEPRPDEARAAGEDWEYVPMSEWGDEIARPERDR